MWVCQAWERHVLGERRLGAGGNDRDGKGGGGGRDARLTGEEQASCLWNFVFQGNLASPYVHMAW